MNEIIDPEESLTAFLRSAAAKQPTPGGGAVAAVAGALAAAMGSMVLNYSVNKKDLAEHRPKLETALASFERSREVLLLLMMQDQEAFLELTEARKVHAQDSVRFAAALRTAITTPQAVGAVAITMLSLVDAVADISNRFLVSDLVVCAELAMATLRSAMINVQANLPDLADAAHRAKLMAENEQMTRHGISLIQKISPRLIARMGRTP